MELHLIRHPRPAIEPGICYGQLDIGIAESAAEVAARLRPLLPQRFDLHASPLVRARMLADQFATPLAPLRLDARLKEIHFGAWEGQAFSTIGAAIDDWAADPLGFRAPGGESAREMTARVLHWLDELQASAPAAPVVVVAHGGPLRVLAGHLLGLPPERWLGLDFGCGQATRLDVEDWGVALRWFNR
ncbi:alpha-ribazole phosphatase family protein [Thauera linaloolentis]|uniref:Putative alpha-ribazole phosphatase n=1 Tax=Thauera linaloolentis (strain DSM 12138 / JCM 21573 / CCUG 41526 / CIP 105981 / IAM 15112 / NBRC 102519 / 47Lol) TaxID=1123367 RepID=N6XS02_THAL4|nr:alpha-ribazole phosphatase family protein [Thauera linaloolentis]ENO84491.1 putative alpha-ribazole phosphatase [Thauera linaloolentis 47Lol = DSM 12138]MCM8564524.1 alpha-ribazole phosphatase family protein [Thauera linaloolentis]